MVIRNGSGWNVMSEPKTRAEILREGRRLWLEGLLLWLRRPWSLGELARLCIIPLIMLVVLVLGKDERA
jgi:hypothetical protein